MVVLRVVVVVGVMVIIVMLVALRFDQLSGDYI
jgi:hypothetical protein